MLAVRRAVYRIRGMQEAEGTSWVHLARLARTSGQFQVASHALMNAAALDADGATVERAKLLREQGDLHRALLELEPVEPDLHALSKGRSKKHPDGAAAASSTAERLLLATDWMQESGQLAGSSVIRRYEIAIKLRPRHEDGYFLLAKYHDFLLRRLNKAPGDSSSSVDASVGLGATREHVKMALEHYGSAMQYGHKYLFQSLPRFLTLWLDRTQDAAKQTAARARPSVRRGLNAKRMERAAGGGGSGSSGSLARDSATVQSECVAELNAVVTNFERELPAYQWYIALAQILSRMGHPHPDVVAILQRILIKILRFYAEQAVWAVTGVTKSEDGARKQHVGEALGQAGRAREQLSEMWTSMGSLFDELIQLALMIPANNQQASSRAIGRRLRLSHMNIAMPVQHVLTASLPHDGSTRRDQEHVPFPQPPVCVQKFSSDMKVMNSKERPKKIGILATDGRVRHFLCKAERTGDLRKDSRMMELNSTINRLLQTDPEGRRRKLRVRTYAVTCLNEQCGLLEWVPQTVGMRHVISRAYAAEGLKQATRITKDLRSEFDRIQDLAAKRNPNAIPQYRTAILSRFPPMLHKWFLQHFPVPTAWSVHLWCSQPGGSCRVSCSCLHMHGCGLRGRPHFSTRFANSLDCSSRCSERVRRLCFHIRPLSRLLSRLSSLPPWIMVRTQV